MIFEEQEHQTNCINSIIRALQGVNLDSKESSIKLLQNLSFLASQNDILAQFPTTHDNRIDVLMETGTGKTFVYINLIYEINKYLNKNKFIIVLPRTAIKLGTIQNINLTSSYFYNLYGKYLNTVVYPEQGIQSVENGFLRGTGIDVLITTNSAFNSQSNVINKSIEFARRDSTIWQSIANLSPLVIIDEPHLLKGRETQRGLDKLDSSFKIRFGATFPTHEKYYLSNVAYVLDSISAFNSYLVKRISVSTLIQENDSEKDRIYNIVPRESFWLSYAANSQSYNVQLKVGDDVGAKTGNKNYNGVRIVRINKSNIRLENNETWHQSSEIYDLSESEIETLMSTAIELHFDREEKLFNKGIKSLSLFFIPSIKDFRGSEPRIRSIFERVYRQIRKKYFRRAKNVDYKNYLKKDFDKLGSLVVHEGYFAGDKGTVEEKERRGVELILKDKEKLLSFDTSLRFIFSVWALQEGWDNPNIFTLCKLKSTSSDISRRQQVGRGLRLPFDQSGKRQSHVQFDGVTDEFYDVNTLNVVVPGREHEFIYKIQQEIRESSFAMVGEIVSLDDLKALGLTDTEAAQLWVALLENDVISSSGKILQPLADWVQTNTDKLPKLPKSRFCSIVKALSTAGTVPVVDNKKERSMVKIRPDQWKKFRSVWESINKSVYMSYDVLDTQRVASIVAEIFQSRYISTPQSHIETSYYDSELDQVIMTSHTPIDTLQDMERKDYANFAIKFSRDCRFPIPFVLSILNKLNVSVFVKNPSESISLLRADIETVIRQQAIDSVKYTFSDHTDFPNELQDSFGKPVKQLEQGKLGRFLNEDVPPVRYLFDKTVYDSSIELQSITQDPSKIGDAKVVVFAKLPRIRIPTPYRTYSPDFAYIVKGKNDRSVFLIVETKGYDDENQIPDDEQLKIRYAQKFFTSLQEQLGNVNVMYKTRVNKQSLSSLIGELTT